jgi:hypothetical protein
MASESREGGRSIKPVLYTAKAHETGTGPSLAGPSASMFKKYSPPILGEAFGETYSLGAQSYYNLPGGGMVQFNLDRLTLSDFRMMRDHYQINASLSVLTFMMHQLDWRIECSNKKIQKHCQENMEKVWTRLVRSLSQAFWAGYSPSVLQWENDVSGKTIQLTKIKDLEPESCEVNWKEVDAWAPPGHAKPKIRTYDGIKQYGMNWPIPKDNTLWYPLLMENQNMYGRKLLRPAFSSWFFSIIIHLFSNRYFERYGEPLAVGRAPYDDTININGDPKSGTSVMLGILQNLRSRGSVVLPSERSPQGNETAYDYQIEYLESQMRGADFERYLTRLDEEMSLAMFTPLLMLRTADVGSYNLGTTHAQVYLQMLNAMAGDWKQYIDEYILDRMVDINFSPTSPRARIVFRKLGDDKLDLVKVLLQQMIANGTTKVNLVELGDIAGLSLEEVQEVLDDPKPKAEPPTEDPKVDDPAGGEDESGDAGESQNSRRVVSSMHGRIAAQIAKAERDGTLSEFGPVDLGHRKQFVAAVIAKGKGRVEADAAYRRAEAYVADVISSGVDGFGSVGSMCSAIERGLAIAVGEG